MGGAAARRPVHTQSMHGVINSGSELLGNMTPYGGASGLPTGSDRN